MAESLWYLDERVTPIVDCGDGWVWCEWSDGRAFKHWGAQLRKEAWA